jgi:hypothetical protein
MTKKRPVLKALRIIAPAVGVAVATLVPLAASAASALIPTGPGATAAAPPLRGPGLSLSGLSGWLWNGPPLLLTRQDGAIMTAQASNGLRGIEVQVQGPVMSETGGQPFTADFSFGAPGDQHLIAASYYNATRESYSGVGPGIDISVMSDGCNEELGHFVIESLKVVGGVVTQFHVKFSDLCDGRGPLQGELWYVEDTSPVVAPALNGPGLSLSGSSQFLWDGPSFSLTKRDGVVLTMRPNMSPAHRHATSCPPPSRSSFSRWPPAS